MRVHVVLLICVTTTVFVFLAVDLSQKGKTSSEGLSFKYFFIEISMPNTLEYDDIYVVT